MAGNSIPDQDTRVLKPIVEQVLELAGRPVEEWKKKLWADHQAMRDTPKIPVSVYYELIPDPHWTLMLGQDPIRAQSDLARRIELELKKRIWMANNVPDDHIVWPSITVPAVLTREVDWGIPFGMAGTEANVDDPLEAKRIMPAFEKDIEPEKIRFSDMEVDIPSTRQRVEMVRELVQDRLVVAVQYPNLGHSPFDLAVNMRGLEELLYDVIDVPEKVHGLMEVLTSGFERHHENRERNGFINCSPMAGDPYSQFGFRVHCAYLAEDFIGSTPRLCDEWAYVSAQTSSGLGPEMYARFVHPYNVRLARYFGNRTVYYHGCERLDEKLDILATLPNLRRLHVSPWSSIEAARNRFEGSVILEAHSHPGKVFFGFSPENMRAELEALVREAEGVPIDINLSDIHSVNGNPGLLGIWAEVAQEVVQKHAGG